MNINHFLHGHRTIFHGAWHHSGRSNQLLGKQEMDSKEITMLLGNRIEYARSFPEFPFTIENTLFATTILKNALYPLCFLIYIYTLYNNPN